ncbi:MAG TPA: hypothetical protein VF990_09590 [Candidatus Dormibacteraeota bacterium]
MAGTWPTRRDPVPILLATGDAALVWAVGHDIQGEAPDAKSLWKLAPVLRILRAQNRDGSWAYRGGSSPLRSSENYNQLATYKQLLVLVSIYRLDRRHPALARAAEFLLGFQTPAGDIRGISGNQYSPYYTADMLRLLIEAGFGADRRVLRGMKWLVSVRQDDGGWAIPFRTIAGAGSFARVMTRPQPFEPDRARPSSHFVTGIVLRALGAHPRYRHRPEAKRAAALLAARFFKADPYPDRADAAYWTKLAFPFRWTDLVSALDAIALVGLGVENAHVSDALNWLIRHQRKDGLWRSGYGTTRDPLVHHWVTFAVARMLGRFFVEGG